ncbi:MAG TPA: hypothetical protein VF797_19685, partial [Noviherbaspirillum sp.]
MKMQDATILLASANRGLGAGFPSMAPERSACKRYAVALGLGLPEASASEAMVSETSRTIKA